MRLLTSYELDLVAGGTTKARSRSASARNFCTERTVSTAEAMKPGGVSGHSIELVANGSYRRFRS